MAFDLRGRDIKKGVNKVFTMRLKLWGFLRGNLPLSEPAVRASLGFASQKSMARSQPTRRGDGRTGGTGSRGRTRNWGVGTGGDEDLREPRTGDNREE